jgi:predicted RNase H-like HicB family nuclease
MAMIVEGYEVTFEQGPTSWGAWVEALPGCVAVAKTREECERLIREGITFHLEGLRLEEGRLGSHAGSQPRT